jgi:hypothetical protein
MVSPLLPPLALVAWLPLKAGILSKPSVALLPLV